MNVLTRSKSKKGSAMSVTETTDTSNKLDIVLAKMDDLLQAKDEQERKLNSILMKLESLETSQKQTAKDVNELKEGYNYLEEQVNEVKRDAAAKATRVEMAMLEKRIDDLENRSKRNNVVIWGLRENVEKEYDSLEAFLSQQLFNNHMGLQNIEVMRAHRTNAKQRASTDNELKPRPIHVYLLRYTDKSKILKAAANALKENAFHDCQIFISDDVSKVVRKNRAKLRKDHLNEIKAREGVEFAFIPWSIPAQILYKENTSTKLKSFKLPTDNIR